MKVVLAETLGFCRGVKNAVDLVYSEVDRVGGENVFMEGPVIHNRILIEDLESRGVNLLKDSVDVKGKSILIRAHGVTPEVESSILDRGGKIVDGTCVIVKASQKKINKYVSEGYYIVITGDKGHPEVIGLVGQAPDSISVVSCKADILDLNLPEKTMLLSQTTFSKKEFYLIETEIKKICPTLKSLCSICGATKIRQDAVKNLVQKVEAIIVIGGLASSNTIRLHRVAAEYVPSWLVESYLDIPDEIKKYKSVGIAAGASTPNRLIKEVVDFLEQL